MAEFLHELESMAASAATTKDSEDIQLVDVQRWQLLFGLSSQHAEDSIVQYRNNFGRSRVSDELWAIVKEEKEAVGFDRESYEFSMQHVTARKTTTTGTSRAKATENTTYILKLESPLDSPAKVQAATSLFHTPEVARGTGETGEAEFCKIDSCTRQKLIDWIAANHPAFRPTIVRLSQSAKQLSSISMAPMLGMETTLPHHRMDDSRSVPMPAQDHYPVWYFFYGNLARSEELQQRLGLQEPPEYVPARVRGGKIVSWRSQYRALVDSDEIDAGFSTHGKAYLIASREYEDILRFYETEKYEVVRCDIEMNGRIVKGLAFRFAGSDEELE